MIALVIVTMFESDDHRKEQNSDVISTRSLVAELGKARSSAKMARGSVLTWCTISIVHKHCAIIRTKGFTLGLYKASF